MALTVSSVPIALKPVALKTRRVKNDIRRFKFIISVWIAIGSSLTFGVLKEDCVFTELRIQC
jgi:hypothetical protein